MAVNGLRKFSLIDYPGKIACVIFLGHCNFRCPFCHNPVLIFDPESQGTLSAEQLSEFFGQRRGKLEAAVFSGGEPSLDPDLPRYVRPAKAAGFAVKLDTNGTRPEIISDLIEKNLVDYFAMDIKNSPEKYDFTAGAKVDMEKIKESISLLINRAPGYEFRTTVVKGFHEEKDFDEIGKLIYGAKKYFLQKFTDSGALLGEVDGACSDEEMEAFALRAQKYIPSACIRGK